MNQLGGKSLRFEKVWITIAILSLPLTIVHADAFRCANGTYTSNPEAHQECTSVNSSVICAKNTGNKYVAPGKVGIAPRVERCIPSQESQSPFVNMASAKMEERSPYKARFEKPLQSSGAKTPKSGLEPEPENELQNIGPEQAGKLLECAANSMFDGGDATNCLSGK